MCSIQFNAFVEREKKKISTSPERENEELNTFMEDIFLSRGKCKNGEY